MPYPSKAEMKSALLSVIERQGGRVPLASRSATLEGDLADYFGLTDQQRRDQRSRSPKRGKTLWRNQLRDAVKTLVREGALDNSMGDELRLTDYGRRNNKPSVF